MLKLAQLFISPFPRNHCVPIAWAHAAGATTPDLAVQLATRARRSGKLTASGRAKGTGSSLVTRWWAQAAGVRVVQEKKLIRCRGRGVAFKSPGFVDEYKPVARYPTLERFARTHAKGRFVVYVRGHAVAVVDGAVLGLYRPRSLVKHYVKVDA